MRQAHRLTPLRGIIGESRLASMPLPTEPTREPGTQRRQRLATHRERPWPWRHRGRHPPAL